MRKLKRWIQYVPVWVWLFLAATQILMLLVRPHELSELEQALVEMADKPAYAKPAYAGVREAFEKVRKDKQFDLVSAAILAPVFLGLAAWRWHRGRPDAMETA